MKKKVNALILRAPGTNCDRETGLAFEMAGASSKLIHINHILNNTSILNKYNIIALPGGFTFGDFVSAGKIIANIIKFRIYDNMKKFVERGGLIIGICNGFQVLIKSGLLPEIDNNKQAASLIDNDSGKFECRWIHLEVNRKSKCVFTTNYNKTIELPVAHAEGKFVTVDNKTLKKLKNNGQIVVQYTNPSGDKAKFPYNPNGSVNNIAGICDSTGRIFGLMPHPERFVNPLQYHNWTKKKKDPDGINIFKNAVNYVRRNIL